MNTQSKFSILRLALIITTAVLVCSILAVMIYQIHNSYANTIENAQQKLLGYAKALDEHASRVFGESEKTLDIIAERISSQQASGVLEEKSLHDIIKAEVIKLPQAAAAFIVDKNGIFKAYSQELPARRINVSDRDYFINLRDNPSLEVYISRPFKNRSNELLRFVIAKKITNKNGGFSGIVAISFKPEYFENFYKSINIGASTRINIMRTDGFTLFVSPYSKKSYEQNYSDRPIFNKYLPASPTGFYRTSSFGFDQSDRIAAYSKLSPYPTMAIVSLLTDEVISGWKSQTTKQAEVAVVLLFMLVITSALLSRQFKKLEISEIHQRGIVEATADGILAVDNKGKVIFANQRFAKLWRIPEIYINSGNDHEMLQFVISQLIDPEAFLAKVKALYGSERIDSDTILFTDGRIFERYSSPLLQQREVIGRIWSFRDITERKQAEEAIRNSALAYRTLSENLPGIVYRVFKREENRMQFFNKTAVEFTGYYETDLSQGIVYPIESLIVDEDRPKVIAAIENAIEEHKPFTVEYRIHRRDGGIRFMLEKGTPIYADDEKILYIDGVIFEITEQKRTEDELIERQSVERAMAKMLMDIHDGIGGITTNITLLSEVAKKASSPEDTEKALEAISGLARDGMVEIRSLMYSLDREDLNWRSLAIELRSQGTKLLEPYSIAFTMVADVKDDIQNPDSHLCLNLFRIYREALINVIKHARATKVTATLHVDKERLVLVIQDNGQGCEQSALTGHGRGIGNMVARADAMHGTVTIKTEGGTCVTVEFPLVLRPIF